MSTTPYTRASAITSDFHAFTRALALVPERLGHHPDP